jgi:TPR repeat protein
MSIWAGAARPDDTAFRQMDAYLSKAIELNPLFAEAYATLAEVRSAQKKPADDVVALLNKAISLDPSDPWIRIAAGRSMWRLDRITEARDVVRVALALTADDARAKAEAERLLATIPQSSSTPASRSPGSAAAGAQGSAAPAAQPSNPNGLGTACQGGDEAACRDLFPLAEQACAGGDNRACLMTATLQRRGMGVPKDEARAAATLERLCGTNMLEACAQWAVMLASDPKKPDLPRARELLTKSCAGGVAQACEVLKGFPK